LLLALLLSAFSLLLLLFSQPFYARPLFAFLFLSLLFQLGTALFLALFELFPPLS